MYFLIPVVFYLLFVLGVLALCMAAARGEPIAQPATAGVSPSASRATAWLPSEWD